MAIPGESIENQWDNEMSPTIVGISREYDEHENIPGMVHEGANQCDIMEI